MYNLYHKLLIKDILLALVILGKDVLRKDDILGINIIHRLLVDIIHQVYSLGVNFIYPNTNYLRIFIIDRLPAKKTEYWQFGAILEDEGFIAGTYRVYDNIFLS
jgi:hypothetical protein